MRAPPSRAFLAWQKFSQTSPDFHIGSLIASAIVGQLSPAEIAAYDAPFPDERFKEGARIFPSLVPTSPDDPAAEANRAAWQVFKAWQKPFVTCFSDSDPVTAGGDAPFRELVPGASNQEHPTIRGAGHFFQEDASAELASLLTNAIAADSQNTL